MTAGIKAAESLLAYSDSGVEETARTRLHERNYARARENDERIRVLR